VGSKGEVERFRLWSEGEVTSVMCVFDKGDKFCVFDKVKGFFFFFNDKVKD
jgi:hypothetical protein